MTDVGHEFRLPERTPGTNPDMGGEQEHAQHGLRCSSPVMPSNFHVSFLAIMCPASLIRSCIPPVAFPTMRLSMSVLTYGVVKWAWIRQEGFLLTNHVWTTLLITPSIEHGEQPNVNTVSIHAHTHTHASSRESSESAARPSEVGPAGQSLGAGQTPCTRPPQQGQAP